MFHHQPEFALWDGWVVELADQHSCVGFIQQDIEPLYKRDFLGGPLSFHKPREKYYEVWKNCSVKKIRSHEQQKSIVR